MENERKETEIRIAPYLGNNAAFTVQTKYDDGTFSLRNMEYSSETDMYLFSGHIIHPDREGE